MKKLFLPLWGLIFAFSCTSTNQNSSSNTGVSGDTTTVNSFSVVSPKKYASFKVGDNIDFQLSLTDSVKKIDSVKVYLGSTSYLSLEKDGHLTLPVKDENLGKQTLMATCFFKDKTQQSEAMEIMVLSDIVPEIIGFKVLNVYPHSEQFYTEGLMFDQGTLYEGTGMEGKSRVVKTDYKTGKLLQELSISNEYFGEGISVIDNKLYQLTYRSKVGFVYDKKTFKEIRKFNYTRDVEGWGLTTDGKNLIMSTGSDRLYVMDTAYMDVIREIKVCDNKNSVDSLNELEYVNGVIYANIWLSTRIAKIDFKTGKVLGYLNLASIVPPEEKGNDANVLNGIAYLPSTRNLFVTGKCWKKMFEIKVGN